MQTPAKPLLAGPKDPLPQPIALGQALLPELQVVEAHAQCYVENALPPSTPCLYGSTGGSVDNDAIDAATDQCDAAAVEHYRYDSDEGRGSCHPSRSSVTSGLASNDFSPSIQARVHVHSNSCSPSAAAGGLQGLLIQVAQHEERGAHVVYNAYRTMPSEAVLPPVLLARHRLMRHMHGSAAQGHTSMLPVSASPAAAHVSSAWDATPHAGSMHSPPRQAWHAL